MGMSRLAVAKCQATGNDFVLLSPPSGLELDYAALARRLCHRRFGIGADGLLAITRGAPPSDGRSVRIFNADGTEAKACGNGMRCVALLLSADEASKPRELTLHTAGGVVRTSLEMHGETAVVRTAMGVPQAIAIAPAPSSFDGLGYLSAEVSIGNAHLVAFVDVDPRSIDLEAFVRSAAPLSRFPDGVNVEIVRAAQAGLDMRVHERGVGETWACGSGACAAAVAGIEMGRARSPVRVSMPGGVVEVAWDGFGTAAFLTGEAQIVFRTEVTVAPHEIRRTVAAR
jgi:diaminopimelate epimerase